MQVRILHLVDLPERSQAAQFALRTKLSIVYDVVVAEDEYLEALGSHAYDLVLASASCSSYSGLEALSYLRQHHPEIPFVFLTTLSEKNGLLELASLDVWDVVSTAELQRLPLTVAHAIEVATLRSELAKAKSLLLKSERSITIGRLLGSITHEINNPLEAISNLLYLAQNSAPADNGEGISTYLQMAEQELHRVGEITKQTLAFHRDSKNAQAVRVAEALESVLVLFGSRLVQRKIEVVRQYRSEGMLVGYLGELRQIFANLIGNAVDAMPNGGRLTLRTREVGGSDPKLYVTIADTGSGMSSEASRRIGELFFTTKGEAGTGLGMWVSQQLIRKYGGSLRVFSSTEVGRSGTVFRLCFRLSHDSLKDAANGGTSPTVLQHKISAPQPDGVEESEMGRQTKPA